MNELRTEILVVGGGLGGVAATLAALRRGRRVVLTEEYPWLGGQLTSQAVPPDEHPWIEEFGATRTYRALRDGIRAHYRRTYPLTDAAREHPALNPGAGWVSKLCHEPRVAVAVIDELLAPWRSAGRLTVLQPARPVSADVDGDLVRAVTVQHLDTGSATTIHADYVLDATETGDLLPLTGTEYVTGFESRAETGEPSAPDTAQPDNQQAISYCFALDHVDGDHTIDRPARYDHWRAVEPAFWGSPLLSFSAPDPRTLLPKPRVFDPNPGDDALAVDADQSRAQGDDNLWTFRRIAARDLFAPGHYASDITLVNWPNIDYFEAPVIDVDEATRRRRLDDAKQLSLSMLYWMQTEAPRPDGGTGWPGLRLRADVVGTADGLAQAPYVREGRRIRAVTTVVEHDLSQAVRGAHGARRYPDSVGIGMYRIDLHPSTGGDNYLDVAAEPFEIPLGALLPQRMRNLLPAGKNIGTTHITNGCYRLHPVEWNIGEAAGHLAASCLDDDRQPHEIQAKQPLLEDFQTLLSRDGVELRWPAGVSGY
ncbi:FAD-dependent oxidoreductase [Jiangella rhizosphaerae]|uniref:FAD-dependent oxidoreductase n=1 Tax=Jiangella rhizosphaerae TaxID=2293569 RepID=A0A418KQ64_9ACTN|nr:FAD-dependent oxidoreductase [Jiangella rhizosphaerae]RIQ22299.1 FAD-dependent oxidoreductase [Jiangella rhizosphaerae]